MRNNNISADVTQLTKNRVAVVAVTLAGIAALSLAAVFFIKTTPKKTIDPSRTLRVTLPATEQYTLDEPKTPQAVTGLKTVTLPKTYRRTTDLGQPSLPVMRASILLPPDVTVDKVELAVSKQHQRPIADTLAPTQPSEVPNPKTETRKENGRNVIAFKDPPVAPDQAAYASKSLYPKNIVQSWHVDSWGNLDVLEVEYTPIRTNGSTKTLTVLDGASINVTYRPSTTVMPNRQNLTRDYITAQAQESLLNPESLTAWYGAGATVSSSSGAGNAAKSLSFMSPAHAATKKLVPKMLTPTDDSSGGSASPTYDLAVIRPDYFLSDLGISYNFQAYGMFALNTTTHWTVGMRGTATVNPDPYNAYYWANNGNTGFKVTDSASGLSPIFEGVTGTNDGTVVAVGSVNNNGKIFYRRPTDQPTQFTQAVLPAGADGKIFHAVTVVDRTNPNSAAWAVGGTADNTGNVVFTASNISNPSSWTQVTVPSTPALRSVYAVGNQVYAVGYQGTILFYNGSTWSTMSSPVNVTLNDIDGSSATDIWAVGDSVGGRGAIINYTGSAWVDVSASNPDQGSRLSAIDVLNPQTRWIVGNDQLNGGLVMRWSQGGNRWISQYVFLPDSYQSAAYVDVAVLDTATTFVMSADNRGTWSSRRWKFYDDPNVLNTYVAFRQSQGYRIETKTLSDIVANFRTDQVVDSVRAYLTNRFRYNGLTHVLIVGASLLVPNDGDSTGFTGVDTVYRDLIGTSGGDEVFVSRVPIYESSQFTAYVQTLMTNETRSDAFQKNALLAVVTDPGGPGLCFVGPGGAINLKNNFLLPHGYSVTSFCGPDTMTCEGLKPYSGIFNNNVRMGWYSAHPFLVNMASHAGASGFHPVLDVDDITNPAIPDNYQGHVWLPEACSTASRYAQWNVPIAFMTYNKALSYVGGTQAVECGSGQMAGRYAPNYFNDLVTNGLGISEAFQRFGSLGFELSGDPLVGPTGMNGRVLSFYSPSSDKTYRGVNSLSIVGSALGPGFQSYSLDWGVGTSPTTWSATGITLNNPTTIKVTKQLATWNTAGITTTGPVTLRLTGIFNDVSVSRQITLTIDNQTCSDGTPAQQCSVTRPKLCQDGTLQNTCDRCGCSNAGDTCAFDGSCTDGCADGTARESCSNPPGNYCDSNAVLHNLSTQCASNDGVSHSFDDCGQCASATTYCAANGLCTAIQSGRGLIGNYYQGSNFDTLKTANVIDPVIDFGSGDGSFDALLSQRVGTDALASIRWDGYIYVPTSQSITYYLRTSAQAKLFIDNMTAPLLDVFMSDSASIGLPVGWHQIRLEYNQQWVGPNATLRLGWKVGGGDYVTEMVGQTQAIPVSYIVPNESLAPTIPGGGSSGKEYVPTDESPSVN